MRSFNCPRPVLFLALLFVSVTAQALPTIVLPQDGDDKHMGVATCASSVCHGKVAKSDTSNVWLNEYRIWNAEDPHSKAYKLLLNKASKRMAKNLGLSSAHTAKICLDCHTDNAVSRSDKKFNLSDGVGCEACHGGAERWLESHAEKDATHEQNLAKGMFPTEDGFSRAQLCLSCHYGTKDKLATHKIMGAGHPRLAFELEAYTANQPAHYSVDADYVERKGSFTGFDIWIVGQIETAKRSLELMQTHLVNQNDLLPELAFFDCHACHHGMADIRWAKTRAKAGMPPGVIRINDANLLMLWSLLEVISPDDASLLLKNITLMHKASLKSKNQLAKSLTKLTQRVTALEKRLSDNGINDTQMRQLRKTLARKAATGEFRDYVAAEQAFFAIDSITITLGDGDGIGANLDKLYESLGDQDKFDPDKFQNIMKKLSRKLSA